MSPQVQTRFSTEGAKALLGKDDLLYRVSINYQLLGDPLPTSWAISDIYVPPVFFQRVDGPEDSQSIAENLRNVAKMQINDWAIAVKIKKIFFDSPLTRSQFYETTQWQKQRDWKERHKCPALDLDKANLQEIFSME